MTPEKVLEVAGVYRDYFEKHGVAKKRLSEDLVNEYFHVSSFIDAIIIRAHCYWMLDEVENLAKNGRTEKAYGWICFVQGILYSTGAFSLNELRDHNRPNDETAA